MIKINPPYLSGNNLKKFFHLLFSVLVIILLLANCKEDPLKFGLDVLPKSDYLGVGYTDTIAVEAYTVSQKHIISSDQPYSPFGSLVDPVFGKTKADFITEFGPDYYRIDLEKHPVIDSIFLDLHYSYHTGDSTEMPDASVYELTSALADSVVYYSDFDPSGIVGNTKINISGAYQINDSTPIIRFRLDSLFGDSLLHVFRDTADLYSNRNLFRNYFKGLYVKTTQVSSGGAIFSLNLAYDPYSQDPNIPTSPLSHITLFYHNDSTDAGTNLQYQFSIYNNFDKRINLLTHDFTGYPVESAINDTIQQDTISYIQSLSGTAVLLKFPDLQKLKEELGSATIMRAELVIPIAAGDTSATFPLAESVSVKAYDNTGAEIYLPGDPIYLGSRVISYFGGILDSEKKQYSLNIGNYIQDYWQGKMENYGLSLFPTFINSLKYPYVQNNAVTSKRTILTSGNNPTRPIQLKITYTLTP